MPNCAVISWQDGSEQPQPASLNSSGVTGQSDRRKASAAGPTPVGPTTRSARPRGTRSSSRSQGRSGSRSTRRHTASPKRSGRTRPTPATTQTGTEACRATEAAALDPATEMNRPPLSSEDSRTTRSEAATALPSPDSATSVTSPADDRKRRARPALSPSASTRRTLRSPRRTRARATSSGQPRTATVASLGMRSARTRGVGSASSSSATLHTSCCGLLAASTRHASDHSGPAVGCRSTSRRQAVTSAAGSSAKPASACAASAASDPGPAPSALATYRSRSMGCTAATLPTGTPIPPAAAQRSMPPRVMASTSRVLSTCSSLSRPSSSTTVRRSLPSAIACFTTLATCS